MLSIFVDNVNNNRSPCVYSHGVTYLRITHIEAVILLRKCTQVTNQKCIYFNDSRQQTDLIDGGQIKHSLSTLIPRSHRYQVLTLT